jgi:HK97 gp10 family phage protein
MPLTLTGVDAFLAALTKLAPDLAAAAGVLETEHAADAADQLRQTVPVVTGTLRRSIHVARTAASGARVSTQIVMGAPYAHFVEFGTRDTPARPAFVPITRRAREAFVRAVVERVRAEGLQVDGLP